MKFKCRLEKQHDQLVAVQNFHLGLVSFGISRCNWVRVSSFVKELNKDLI